MGFIILNGTSSAGKTSIAKSLQSKLEGKFLHVQMDTFWDMLPAGTSPSEFPNMKYAIIGSVETLLKHGHNVIFDLVCPASYMNSVLETLRHHQPYVVLVKPSLHVLAERERQRPDRKAGLAESQFLSIYKDAPCDVELDNSLLSAEQSATVIATAYQQHEYKPSAVMPSKRNIPRTNGPSL